MHRMSTMVAGVLMTAVNGGLLVVWLWMNTGTGYVGLLFVIGMLVGLAVFASGSMEQARIERGTGSRRYAYWR